MHRRRFELTRGIAVGLVAMTVLIHARTAEAQTLTNPRYVVFAPSPDHNSTASSGAPVVRSYQLEIYPYGGSQALAVLDLGKPDPEPDGYIRVNFANLLASPPSTGTALQAVIAAVGAGGTSRSGASGAFTFNGCGYYVSPVSVAISGAGGTAASTVSTSAGCDWIGNAEESWLALASGPSGSGAAGITVSAAPNPYGYGRTGTVAVGSAVIVVNQSAATTSSATSTPTSGSSSGVSPDGTTVPTASSIVDASGAVWTIGGGSMILRNGAQAAGGYGAQILWTNSTIYVLGTDANWWRWTGSGWNNIGRTAPTTSGSVAPVSASGPTVSPDGTTVPSATQIVDNSGAVWTLGSNSMILRNSVQAGGGYGSQILWTNSTIYVLGTDANWWRWTGSGWNNVGRTAPATSGGAAPGSTTSPTVSPDGTTVPSATQIVDNSGAVWTIGSNSTILRNGVQAAGGYGSQILWKSSTIYVLGTDANWWKWTGSTWTNTGALTAQGSGGSPNGTTVPNASQIVDNSGAVWTIGANFAILRNGVQAAGGLGTQILWKDNTIYVYGVDGQWWQWSGSTWFRV
jgi:hypothetical protein